MDAPYPGLHPELWDVVRALGPEPPLTIGNAEMRAQYAAHGKGDLTLPDGLRVEDGTLSGAARPLPYRSFIPPADPRGTMLYLHGGGWVLAGSVEHDQICADLAAATGFRIVSLDYALSPEHRYPVALTEAVEAFDHLRGQSDGPLWIGGDSAGGNLALGAALWLRDRGGQAPDGLFLAYPCVDPACASPSHSTHSDAPDLSRAWMLRFWAEYLGTAAPDRYAAPALDALAGLPPLVVLTAALDPLVDEGDAIATRTDGPVWHERVEGVIHSFLRYRAQSPTCEAAFQRACAAISGFSSVARPDPGPRCR